ncbi:MAG: sugar phosphate isomerase/epimerase [Bacteroidota bacterium]
MSNRRTFIKQSSALALGSLAVGQAFDLNFDKKGYDLGVQLYTLMAVIDADTKGTLEKVAALGYKNIESAFSRQGGFYGKTAKEFAAMLKEMGLTWRAHHVLGAPFKMPPGAKPPTDAQGNPIKIPAMKNLKDNMQELVDDVAKGGIEYLVCANIPTSTPEEVAEAVTILTKTGELCHKAGFQLVYHNHDWEFKTVGESTPYEVFLKEIPSDLMKMELDLAWATKAGIDPVELFKKHPGRFPLWHVKDISADFLTLKPVGEGVVDFKRIFKSSYVAGLKYPFVEHDQPADALASLTASKNWLKKNVLK